MKDLIEKLIQLDPLERLGCAMTGHDMSSLRKHPFFHGINFNSNLAKTTDVHTLLKE